MEAEAAKYIGAGLATMGMIGAGVGLGNIFASFISAVGRNPSAAGAVQSTLFLGMALVEAVVLFALVVALLVLFG